EHRQMPKARHVEALVHLPLVDGPVAEVREADIAVLLVLVAKGETGADRHLGRNDAMAAVESLLAAEHVHRTALAFGITRGAAGEFRHDAFGVHAAGEHVAVIAIAGDD